MADFEKSRHVSPASAPIDEKPTQVTLLSTAFHYECGLSSFMNEACSVGKCKLSLSFHFDETLATFTFLANNVRHSFNTKEMSSFRTASAFSVFNNLFPERKTLSFVLLLRNEKLHDLTATLFISSENQFHYSALSKKGKLVHQRGESSSVFIALL